MFSFFKKKKEEEIEVKEELPQEKPKLDEIKNDVLDDEAYVNPVEIIEEVSKEETKQEEEKKVSFQEH